MPRYLFVTGKLAEPALRQVLAETAPAAGFEYDVAVLNIAVAALMTAPWVARKLSVPPGFDKVFLPGFVGGDLGTVRDAAGLPVELGPKDLRDLPSRFGRSEAARVGYGDHALEIIAEINHAPRMPTQELLALARRYRDAGADVIDVGCDPDGPWSGVGAAVKALRDEGLRVSIDSLHPREIEDAVAAGAELVLSINSANLATARGLTAEVVAIPDTPADTASLDRTVEQLTAWGTRWRIDPILEPVGFGFAGSLGRYIDARRRHPSAAMMMGVGNLTELSGVDSAGINFVLAGFCRELNIGSVLTTEVAGWCRSCVRELDLARRLVHFAVSRKIVPKHIEPALHLLRDERVHMFGDAALRRMQAMLRDRNFRIFAENGTMTVMNSEVFLQGRDPFELLDKLGPLEPSHAFYLGYEMAKAVTALTLGKNYRQDEALNWGFLNVPETSHRAKKGRSKAESRGGERETDGHGDMD